MGYFSKELLDSCDRMTANERVIAEKLINRLDVGDDVKICMIAVLHNPYQINKLLEDNL